MAWSRHLGLNTQHLGRNSCKKGCRAPWRLGAAPCFHLPQLLTHSKHHPPRPHQTEVDQRSWNTTVAESTSAFSFRVKAGPKSTREKNTTPRPDWLAPREFQPIGAVCNAGVGSVEALPLVLVGSPLGGPAHKNAYTYQHRNRALSLGLGLLIPTKLSFSLTISPAPSSPVR